MADNIETENLDDEGTPTYTIIQKIKDGQIDVSHIDKDTRKQCVAALDLEGYSPSQLAQLFKCNERTIRRIREAIREDLSLSINPEFAKKEIGEFWQKGNYKIDLLMRLANKEAAPIQRAKIIAMAFTMSMKLMEKLQSLGYLPSQYTGIAKDFFSPAIEKNGVLPIPKINYYAVSPACKNCGTRQAVTELTPPK